MVSPIKKTCWAMTLSERSESRSTLTREKDWVLDFDTSLGEEKLVVETLIPTVCEIEWRTLGLTKISTSYQA